MTYRVSKRPVALRPRLSQAAALAATVLPLLAMPGLAATSDVDWSLHGRACAETVVADLSVACGDLGVLSFGVRSAGDCSAVSRGVETPPLYPLPLATAERSGSAGGREMTRVPVPDSRPWAAVVDWSNWHGRSVRALVEAMSLRRVEPVLYALDDPGLGALGDEIGDAHVLATLCRVAEDAALRQEPLLTVNLSFGRLATPADPRGASDCAAGGPTLGCQIAAVLGHLTDRGAAVMAAAGNHQDLLFPASLDETLAAGAIDLFHYGAGHSPQPQWESPAQSDALVPGHGLCLDGQVAPAGSSYASALFAGWYSMLAAREPALHASAGRWLPVWSEADGCFLLARDGEAIRECNPSLREVLAGLTQGGPESGCWEDAGADGRPLLTLVPGPRITPPDVPSFDEWAAGTQHPAPESDPCIPCVGFRPLRESRDIEVSISAAVGIDAGFYLDRLFLRSGDGFYPLNPTDPGDLEAFVRGAAGGLVLRGLDALPEIDSQPSLAYLVKTERDADCSIPGTGLCFWTTTPLMIR